MNEKEQILTRIRHHLKQFVEGWDDKRFSPDLSLNEMDVDSLDSVQVLFSVIKDLKLKLPKNAIPQEGSVNTIADQLISLNKQESKDNS